MDFVIERKYIIKMISFHGAYGQEFYFDGKKFSFDPWGNIVYVNDKKYHYKIEKFNDMQDIIWVWS